MRPLICSDNYTIQTLWYLLRHHTTVSEAIEKWHYCI